MSLLQLANQPDKRRIRRPVIVPFFHFQQYRIYIYILDNSLDMHTIFTDLQFISGTEYNFFENPQRSAIEKKNW